MSDQLYYNFETYISTLKTTSDLAYFKNNDNVLYMLEHVSYEQGNAYLTYIKSHTTLTNDQIISYCNKNDKIGNGQKYNYGFITTSPSNFRYILHSHLILSHIRSFNKNEIKLVEVGCGYGGLCLALTELSSIYNITIISYNLIDLPIISKFQQLYLSNFNISVDLHFHSSYTYGSEINDNDLFLVSNYCFSEIADVHQKQYIKNLFQKVSHGFMTWNHIPVYDFGFTIKEEIEYPLTGHLNKYIYF